MKDPTTTTLVFIVCWPDLFLSHHLVRLLPNGIFSAVSRTLSITGPRCDQDTEDESCTFRWHRQYIIDKGSFKYDVITFRDIFTQTPLFHCIIFWHTSALRGSKRTKSTFIYGGWHTFHFLYKMWGQICACQSHEQNATEHVQCTGLGWWESWDTDWQLTTVSANKRQAKIVSTNDRLRVGACH